MRLQGILASSVLVLGGCATFESPIPIAKDGLGVPDLAKLVECELASVYLNNIPHATLLDHWVAETELDLNLTSSAESVPAITITPVVSGASMTVPLGADATDEATTKGTFTFDIHMKDLISGKINQNLQDTCQNIAGIRIENGLGLKQWLYGIVATAGDPDNAPTLVDISYTIDFTVNRTADGGITFKTGVLDAELGKQTAIDNKENKLIVTFAPEQDKGAATPSGKTKTGPKTAADLAGKIKLRSNSLILVQPDGTLAISPTGD